MEELFNQQEKKFKIFKEFVRGKNFKEIRDYYVANELHMQPSPPAVYIFTFNKCKKYVGKADELFKRLYNYIQCDGSYIHEPDLKDDMMMDMNKFEYEILTEYDGEKITYDNVAVIESIITTKYRNTGIPIYNRNNFNFKGDLKSYVKTPYNTNKIIKGNEKKGEDFRGFADIFD